MCTIYIITTMIGTLLLGNKSTGITWFLPDFKASNDTHGLTIFYYIFLYVQNSIMWPPRRTYKRRLTNYTHEADCHKSRKVIFCHRNSVAKFHTHLHLSPKWKFQSRLRQQWTNENFFLTILEFCYVNRPLCKNEAACNLVWTQTFLRH